MNDIFHKGELQIQKVMGVRKESNSLSSMIKDFIPTVAKEFLEELDFCVLAVLSKEMSLHTFLVYSIDRFIEVIDDKHIIISLKNYSDIPNNYLDSEILEIGFIGLDFENKKRIRLNGQGRISNKELEIKIEQIYSNCPKYITKRVLKKQLLKNKKSIEKYTYLTDEIKELISFCDTFFISSSCENGVDVSYKGGLRGFIKILDDKKIQFQDLPGNNFFNSLGNIYVNSYINMIFIDFKKGDTYLLKGNATLFRDEKGIIVIVKSKEILVERNSFLLEYKEY